jgi:hypothetical protein
MRKTEPAFLTEQRKRGRTMGYTTEFTGAVGLSRKLTLAEAKELLEINASDKSENITGIDAYFQWVPADTFEHIVWDGNEKFYKYVEQLRWLCNWFQDRRILANGTLYWQGEETGDTGTLAVVDNAVSVNKNARPGSKSPSPLTLEDLGKIALEQLTAS